MERRGGEVVRKESREWRIGVRKEGGTGGKVGR